MRPSRTTSSGQRTGSGPAVHPDLLPHLRRAHDRLHRHYAEPLDVDGLARTAGVSRAHFLRSYAAVYGRPPGRDLTARRLERAQDLLRATTYSVTEVCHLVGYTSLGSFSALFRAATGESPSAYQARWAATGAPHVPGCWLFMRGLVAGEHPDEQQSTAGEAADDVPPLASGA